MRSRHSLFYIFCLLFSQSFAWENLPQIPTGRRSQYLLLENNGGYKYGYDTGHGSSAKQTGSPDNQVEGHYFYTDPTGQQVDLKYTSGVQGFVPEGLEALQQAISKSAPAHGISHTPHTYQPSTYSAPQAHTDDQAGTGDASYSFTVDTDTYQRKEVSDASGNVKGHYSFKNEAGSHDLSYIAGQGTGFVATSGSLSQPNGILGAGTPSQHSSPSSYHYPTPSGVIATRSGSQDGPSDASYSFSYTTGDSDRHESSDPHGNVQGKYSYKNEAGTHDLSYVAGSSTGFQVTGGSLASPNGLEGRSIPVSTYSTHQGHHSPSVPHATTRFDGSSDVSAISDDGSYSFSYSTGDSSRHESSDPSGNVQGKYSYQNEAGTHDLSYVAGSSTGFQVTGGSLSAPNGLTGAQSTGQAYHKTSQPSYATTYAGTSSPASRFGSVHTSSPSTDGSYSFSYSTGDSDRMETSDASGNVQGKYSYKNADGTHDLTYVAGSATGFLPTGGSLANANGLNGGSSAHRAHAAPSYTPSVIAAKGASYDNQNSEDDLSGTGDSSYSFVIDTDTYTRKEVSDPSGNVQGSYSYKNAEGSHDLTYVAGSATGFLATGGSLKDAPGLSEAQLKSGHAKSHSSAPSGYAHTPAQSYTPQVGSRSGASAPSSDDQANTGDASYAFSIDTDSYVRHESSDPHGNVMGSYSYKNGAGSHDLKYVAGSATGFLATGGSLQTPPGLSEAQLRSGAGSSFHYSPPQAPASRAHSGHASNSIHTGPSGISSYSLDNIKVKTYLPPSQDKQKFGYVFDSQ